MAEREEESKWGTEALRALEMAANTVEHILGGDDKKTTAPPGGWAAAAGRFAADGVNLADAVREYLARTGVSFDAETAKDASQVTIRFDENARDVVGLSKLAQALVDFEMPPPLEKPS
jgi:hypothetical protein